MREAHRSRANLFALAVESKPSSVPLKLESQLWGWHSPKPHKELHQTSRFIPEGYRFCSGSQLFSLYGSYSEEHGWTDFPRFTRRGTVSQSTTTINIPYVEVYKALVDDEFEEKVLFKRHAHLFHYFHCCSVNNFLIDSFFISICFPVFYFFQEIH